MNMREEFEATELFRGLPLYVKEASEDGYLNRSLDNEFKIFCLGYKAALAAQPQQNHIADTSKLAQAVNVIASQTGESAESIIEWLTDQGGLTQLMLSHFGGIAAQAQQESQWMSIEEAKATLKDGDLIFAYCEFYGVVEATYAFEEGYYNPHRIVKKNGDSYRINTFTHFMVRKPTSLPPAPEGGDNG